MKKLCALALLSLALAGCATPPAPPAAEDPRVYRPTKPVSYPAPFE